MGTKYCSENNGKLGQAYITVTVLIGDGFKPSPCLFSDIYMASL